MNAAASLVLGGLGLAAAFGAVLFLLLGPQPLPASRRRFRADGPRAISRAADAASSMAQRMLGDREGAWSDSLQRAGVKLRPQDFGILVGSVAVAAFAVGLVAGNFLLAFVAAAAVPALAWLGLRIMTGRRRTAFASQLEETLQIIAGGLRAGYSLPQAVATVAAEASEPTAEEFSRIINEARVGRPLVDALEEAAARVKSDDFHWVVQAIAINREVGGNLADVLEGVGETIRERIHLKRQVSALAAEGKLSALILCALPPFMLIAVSIMNPTYFGRFFESLIGIGLLVVSAIMMTCGILWMRSIVNIKF